MSEQKRWSDLTVKLVHYCRSCAKQYGLPVGEGNRLPHDWNAGVRNMPSSRKDMPKLPRSWHPFMRFEWERMEKSGRS